MQERIQILCIERLQMYRLKRPNVQMIKNLQGLIKFEITSSENIKENVSKFGILIAHSQLDLCSQNVTASLCSPSNISILCQLNDHRQ